MRLDNNIKLFKEIIEKTSAHFHVLNEYTEKDYWLTLLLKEIFKRNNDYVFKGGTSLSKCHHLINRFSEDIDISYEKSYFEIGISEKERKYKGISSSIKNVGIKVLHPEKLNRDGYFNRFECPYETLFDSKNVENKVIVELAAQTPSFPTIEKPIQSFVGEYLEKTGRHDLVIQYELEPFIVKTQSLSRTLVDKIFAICDYYLSHKCEKHSRHLYDISKILGVIELNEDIVLLFKQVREYRKNNPICLSAKDNVDISNILDEIITNDAYKEDYNNQTARLLYESYPYSKCIESLKQIRKLLIDYSLL